MTLHADLRLIFVGDPMCSWCWGMAPVLEQAEERFGIPLRVIVGGLRPGPGAQPLTQRMKSFLAGHWARISQMTGQPFNTGIFEWDEGWIYDTELPAIGVVTMRELDEQLAFPFFTTLQRAFYVDNVDITNPAGYPDLAAEFDVDQKRFIELLGSEAMKRLAWEDFAQARRLGITGFPSLLLREDGVHHPVATGYSSMDDLDAALGRWAVA